MVSKDLAKALATDPKPLDSFEGAPVLSVGMEIPGAAGGLRESMALDPVQLHKGDTVFVLLETTVDKIRFDPVKDSDGWKRVHVLAAERGMIVEADLVRSHLDEQGARIAEAKADADRRARQMAGEITLEEAALEAEHEDGQHTELVEECPACALEIAAEQAEKDDAEREGGFGPEDS